jgi:predicted branched-subunit amino acid permease
MEGDQATLPREAAPSPQTGAASFLFGLREALGAPGLIMGASFVGFGSLVQESGLSLPFGLISSATGWALPGQLALMELYGAGAGLLAIALAVGLANARLLPMSITALPLMRHPRHSPILYWIAAHFIAATGWAQLMRRSPMLRPEHRLAYYFGLTTTLWVISLVSTAIGWVLAGQVPRTVTLGLVFLNPLYFLMLFLIENPARGRLLALGFGAALGPILHLLTPDWGLLLCGLIAGTLAFALDRIAARRGNG